MFGVRQGLCVAVVALVVGLAVPAGAINGYERCATHSRRIARRVACEQHLRDLHRALPPGKIMARFGMLAPAPTPDVSRATAHELQLLKAAATSPRAAREAASFLEHNPTRTFDLLATGELDRKTLELSRVQRAVARVLGKSTVAWVRDLGKQLVTAPSAALDQLGSETVRIGLADLERR